MTLYHEVILASAFVKGKSQMRGGELDDCKAGFKNQINNIITRTLTILLIMV